MSDLYAAIEEAVKEAAEDTGYSEDEVFYDIAMSILPTWPNQEEAHQFAWAHGWKSHWSPDR